MKTKRAVTITFFSIFTIAMCAYLAVNFSMSSSGSYLPQDVGKIKYVTTEGNEVFASNTAVVFNRPVQICDVAVINNVAHITVSEFSIIRSPALGVVTKSENGKIEIDHGNDTISSISGITTLGVVEGDYVCAGEAIGTTESEITFSVNVSELPLDMMWLVKEFEQNENSSVLEK